MKSIVLLAVTAAAAMLFQTASADEVTSRAVPGQKLDSGLGELPHYRYWSDPTGKAPVRLQVAGQKLDSGLGELPHYRDWTDPSGKMPVRQEQVVAESTQRK